jgi:hypothetical protein
MTKIDVSVDNDSFQDVISQVAESGERAIIEQEGQAIAAIISYTDLKRLEELEAVLLKKAELEEYEWLKAVVRNPAFDFLKDSEEDIYTVADGEPFHDPEWNKVVANDTTSHFITDPEEDIYTLEDGEPFRLSIYFKTTCSLSRFACDRFASRCVRLRLTLTLHYSLRAR